MLRFEIDLSRTAALQDEALESGLHKGNTQADAIHAFRVALESVIRCFNRRAILANGRAATLADALESIGRPPRPRRGAALLRGLHGGSTIALPDRIGRGWASPHAVDPHSYLFRLDLGPPGDRDFPTMTALGLYMDCYATMRILWIGEATGYAAAVGRLFRETRDMSDWSSVYPAFDAWLRVAGA